MTFGSILDCVGSDDNVVLLGAERDSSDYWHNKENTTGPWTSEAETCEAFDEWMRILNEWFVVHREVPGYLLQPKIGQEPKGFCRIDRVLVPTDALITKGWTIGPIGVEIKKPGSKIGPAIAQILDYSRCAFNLGNEFWMIPQWHFLFHIDGQGGMQHSLMLQSRIGSVSTERRHLGKFNQCDGSRFTIAAHRFVAKFTSDGKIERVRCSSAETALAGSRVGSR